MQIPSKLEIEEQDVIETFGPIAKEFFFKVLEMDMSAMLLTDSSSLSDFSFSGPAEFHAGRSDSASLKDAYSYWDAKVIAKVKEVFGLEIATTRLPLIELFSKLEILKATQETLH